MKNTLLASVAAIALSTSAFAADLPRRAAPVAPAPVATFTWAGAYVGLSAGFISNKVNAAVDMGEGFRDGDSYPTSPSNGGGLAGVTLGFNFQNGSLVYGIEADFGVARSSLKKFVDTDNFVRNSLNSFGTLRARIGFALQPRTIVYATGGLAVGHVQSAYHVDFDSDYCRSGFSGMKAGWTVGAGIEHAFRDNITLKVEGLYYDLGKKAGNLHPTPTFEEDCRASFKNTGFVGRVGLNFKF